MSNIKLNCCISNYFIYDQTNRISKLIYDKYNINPEFLFDDKSIGVFRNKDNLKWFGIIMNKNSKKMASYLNENASIEEFEKINSNLERLERIITDDKVRLMMDTFTKLTGLYSVFVDVEGNAGYEMLTDGLGSNAIIVKSQTHFTTYYEDYDIWDGSLDAVDNEHLYMIKMSDEQNLPMIGAVSDPSQLSPT